MCIVNLKSGTGRAPTLVYFIIIHSILNGSFAWSSGKFQKRKESTIRGGGGGKTEVWHTGTIARRAGAFQHKCYLTSRMIVTS